MLWAKLKPPKVGVISGSAQNLSNLGLRCNWNEAPTAGDAVTSKDTRIIPLSTTTIENETQILLL